MKISPQCEYKHMISDLHYINIDEINDSIASVPSHSSILCPTIAIVEDQCLYLKYQVCESGSTLRDFITKEKTRNARRTITFNTIRPVALILQLIEIYEFMILNDMLTGQPNVNPDNLWVDQDETGNLQIFVLYTMEHNIGNVYRANQGREYWPAEIAKEYNSLFYNDDFNPTLIWCNTRSTPINVTYSLGLVLYFIVTGYDAFDKYRLHPSEMPVIGPSISEYIKKLILSATDTNYKTRPSLSEWKAQMKRRSNRCILT